MSKRILCFGDSNTWGYDPLSKTRFDRSIRWPAVMASQLGDAYEIIEEGLCGRTTVWDDPVEGGSAKNGLSYLIPCLESHCPLDLVIVLLGVNDLKRRFNVSARDIANSAGVLIQHIQISRAGSDGQAPPVLLLAPAPTATLTDFAETMQGAEEKSRLFGSYYQQIADEMNCAFLDTGQHIVSSPVDGIHLDACEQQKLGRVIASSVHELLTP